MLGQPKTDPRQFSKTAFFKAIGYTPHAGQVKVHRSTAPRRVLACGVRFGKSLCAAAEALSAAMAPCDRSFGWVVGPTYDLADKVFRECSYLAARRIQNHVISIKDGEKRILLRNLAGGVSEIKAKSADNPTSLLGEGLDWTIVDEAARLKPAIWESHLSQRLIDKRGWALLISTPRGKGLFYDLYRRGQSDDPDYESWNAPSWVNPHLDRDLIERERDRLPDRVFRQEFGGEFVEGAGQVFRNVRECATGDWQEPVTQTTYYAGLDLAKTEDYTVLIIVNRDREVVFMDRFHRIDWEQQVQRIIAATERYRVQSMVVDSTGKGEPVFEALRRAGARATAYPFTARSKAALVDNLSLMLEKKIITLPKPSLAPELIDELESFQYSTTDSGNIRTGAPSGYHDDAAIALALAAWELRESKPQCTVASVPIMIYSSEGWH
ncbi:MAG: hypothetical protein DHS20C21_09150 [Gemmatimonadota bacterium]|nr:MAG: hypothetical protein DHS20C21_09150 [Gemmatimonadota bacterium]